MDEMLILSTRHHGMARSDVPRKETKAICEQLTRCGPQAW
jgi:hypothetical protein